MHEQRFERAPKENLTQACTYIRTYIHIYICMYLYGYINRCVVSELNYPLTYQMYPNKYKMNRDWNRKYSVTQIKDMRENFAKS